MYLQVAARDKGDPVKESFATVYIDIIDANNKPPSFPDATYFLLVKEGKDRFSNFANITRVATVREKVLENEKISRSGKSQGITFSVREI